MAERPLPQDIEGVLAALTDVIARSKQRRSRLGYFAAIYHQVTATVKDGIGQGFFDDDERMGRLDTVFANRYLEALRRFERGEVPTLSWDVAFRAAPRRRPIILQHVLLGINAHINLDLGIAAAKTAPGDELPDLRRDFDRINEILGSLIRTFADRIGRVSPWIALLDRAGGPLDDEFVRFNLEVARAEAWRFAIELAPLPREHWPGPVRSRDARTQLVARGVLRPGPLEATLLVIRLPESNDVRKVIEVLEGTPQPDLDRIEQRVQALWAAAR